MATAKFLLDFISANQANADVQHNLALVKLDALVGHFIVLNQTTSAQPASPAVGDCYLIAGGATGVQWAGQDGNIAVYSALYGGWLFFVPPVGSTLFDISADSLYVKKAGGWVLIV